MIQALRAREAALIEREASLTAEFGAAYPNLQSVQSSLQNLRRQIAQESNRSYAAALELVERSRAREQSMERSVLALTNEVNSSDAGLRQLQENAESIRSLLQRFEKRLEETAAEPAFITANSTIITQADPLVVAKSPIPLYLTAAAGFVGFVAGVLLAVFFERRDTTFQTSLQIEQHLEPRAVGATPRAIGQARRAPANVILNDRHSVLAEAFRVSWTNVQLAFQGPEVSSALVNRRSIVLGITSATTGEGKSTHALGFARTAALAGESVVLVDADLRRSGVSRLLEQEPGTNLKDFLAGRCTAGELIGTEPRSGMHFIRCTPAASVWTSPHFRQFGDLLGYLRARFAIIIVDLRALHGRLGVNGPGVGEGLEGKTFPWLSDKRGAA